jgi:hypothetical protein
MTTYAQTNIGITTTGSFMHGVADKTKWGDFELVLKMQKTAFTEQEPIHVVLVFRNTGDKGHSSRSSSKVSTRLQEDSIRRPRSIGAKRNHSNLKYDRIIEPANARYGFAAPRFAT